LTIHTKYFIFKAINIPLL